MKGFTGFLFSRLGAVGSKSEGPEYYLQQWNDKNIHVIKRADLWLWDETLDKYINKRIVIFGELRDGRIEYKRLRLKEK